MEVATQAGDASSDGDRTLIDLGYSSRHGGKRYRDVALTLVDAMADGRELILDVAPLNDNPKVFHDLLVGRSLSFAACPASEPTPSGPLAPLGPTTGGGRAALPGSGFAVSFPADWDVEMTEPDPDLALAIAGDAWEALRAYGPGRHQTCSVYVAVVTPGSADPRFMRTPGLRELRWADSVTRSVLQIPDPRDRVEEPSGFWSGASGDFDRLAANDPMLDHDVVYALHCAADVDATYDSTYSSA